MGGDVMCGRPPLGDDHRGNNRPGDNGRFQRAPSLFVDISRKGAGNARSVRKPPMSL